MQVFTGFVLFAVIWWMVFFTVLPWGNQITKEPEPGHADSAPTKPRLWLKVAVTTGISLVLFAAAFAVIESGWVSFRRS